MNVFLDLDGVLVDLERGFLEKCGYSLQDVSHLDSYETWKDALNVPKFWRNLPKTHYAERLVNKVTEVFPASKIHILSAYQRHFKECKQHKIEWVNEHFPEFDDQNINIVKRKDKVNFAKYEGGPNILIDDYSKNIKAWEKYGGIGIRHSCVHKTIDQLSEILQ